MRTESATSTNVAAGNHCSGARPASCLKQERQGTSCCTGINELRQRKYDVHHDTHSIVLIFCDARWPHPTITREPGWARLSDVAQPLMDEIIAKFHPAGGTILRAMAARLEVGGTIKPHVDALDSFAKAHRIHIPLTTSRNVRFTVDGRPCPMEVGRAYEINNQKVHSVMNRGKDARISFIFDYCPPLP